MTGLRTFGSATAATLMALGLGVASFVTSSAEASEVADEIAATIRGGCTIHPMKECRKLTSCVVFNNAEKNFSCPNSYSASSEEDCADKDCVKACSLFNVRGKGTCSTAYEVDCYEDCEPVLQDCGLKTDGVCKYTFTGTQCIALTIPTCDTTSQNGDCNDIPEGCHN